MTSFSAVSLQGEEEKLSMQRSFCTLQCWSGASKDHTVLVRCFTKTSFSENQRVYMPTLNGAEEKELGNTLSISKPKPKESGHPVPHTATLHKMKTSSPAAFEAG